MAESLLAESLRRECEHYPDPRPGPEQDWKEYTNERFQKSPEYCRRFLARRTLVLATVAHLELGMPRGGLPAGER